MEKPGRRWEFQKLGREKLSKGSDVEQAYTP
jgi:hypothetical protein